jgi:hypothetical protein
VWKKRPAQETTTRKGEGTKRGTETRLSEIESLLRKERRERETKREGKGTIYVFFLVHLVNDGVDGAQRRERTFGTR